MTRLLLLSALVAAPAAATADVPRVVTDILPVHGLVSRVMDGVGTPELLLPPGASPHGYSMRPSEAGKLEQADVVVWIGAGLTPWLENSLDTLAGDATRVTLTEVEGTILRPFSDDHDHGAHGGEDDHDDHDDHGHDDHEGHEDHGHDDHGEADHDDHAHDDHEDHDEEHAHDEHEEHGEEHAHDDHAEHGDDHEEEGHFVGDGHDHGADDVDPHAWLDPVNGALWLATLAETLATADPENAELYRANAVAGQAEIAAVSTEVETRLASVGDAAYLVFHDAYGYFEDRFDIASSGAIRLGDATTPGAARIAELQDRIADDGIACLFTEPQFPAGLAETVVEGSGATLATIDPLGTNLTQGSGFYPDLISALANDMAGCLSR
ncbi:zinc ABC transporter substrate-binding protein [Jannaschia sp. 2305UL9-9]|uniref:zinc ABC transporter substrate-binding protein n=1 Tax=Jannaschia sp. 2305UL9-9 TaxID=3121638 RepID=UPI0035286388